MHASADFLKFYYRLPRQEIAYLRFLLESYDGLAFARTLDQQAGLVEIACPGERAQDLAALLAGLSAEVPMQRVAEPEHVPPL